MSEHKVSVSWQRGGADFRYESYPREHDVRFEGGVTLRASAAPEYRGQLACPNPEEGLVFAASSCHMLTFLAIAAKRGLVVDSYEDHAVGVLAKNESGKLAVTRITLRPKITWGGAAPSAETLQRMHEASHRECFIANSVKSQIDIEAE
jgi:organic hydroperoxide reductase OsmC/OhrA